MAENPLFVVGFWRSGTTLLLCQGQQAGNNTQAFSQPGFTKKWLKKFANTICQDSHLTVIQGYDFRRKSFTVMSLQPSILKCSISQLQ
jgi:hypothetical protein